MTMAVLMLHRLVRDPATPWSDPRLPRLRGAARTAIFTAEAPLIVGCGVIDQLLAPVVRRAGGANCYRILARRPLDGHDENLAEFISFA